MSRISWCWVAALVISDGAYAQVACQYEVAAVIQAPNGPFGPSPTRAIMAISPNGRYVVGYFNPSGAGFDRGFWFDLDTQQFHILPFPGDGYQSSYCNDVNDAGRGCHI